MIERRINGADHDHMFSSRDTRYIEPDFFTPSVGDAISGYYCTPRRAVDRIFQFANQRRPVARDAANLVVDRSRENRRRRQFRNCRRSVVDHERRARHIGVPRLVFRVRRLVGHRQPNHIHAVRESVGLEGVESLREILLQRLPSSLAFAAEGERVRQVVTVGVGGLPG